mgnify:CR=1 FL=1
MLLPSANPVDRPLIDTLSYRGENPEAGDELQPVSQLNEDAQSAASGSTDTSVVSDLAGNGDVGARTGAGRAVDFDDVLSNTETVLTDTESAASTAEGGFMKFVGSGALGNVLGVVGLGISIAGLFEDSGIEKTEKAILDSEKKIVALDQEIQAMVSDLQAMNEAEEEQLQTIQNSINKITEEVKVTYALSATQAHINKIEFNFKNFVNGTLQDQQTMLKDLSVTDNTGIEYQTETLYKSIIGKNVLDEQDLGLLEAYFSQVWTKLAPVDISQWAIAVSNVSARIYYSLLSGMHLTMSVYAMAGKSKDYQRVKTQYNTWVKQYWLTIKGMIPSGLEGYFPNLWSNMKQEVPGFSFKALVTENTTGQTITNTKPPRPLPPYLQKALLFQHILLSTGEAGLPQNFKYRLLFNKQSKGVDLVLLGAKYTPPNNQLWLFNATNPKMKLRNIAGNPDAGDYSGAFIIGEPSGVIKLSSTTPWSNRANLSFGLSTYSGYGMSDFEQGPLFKSQQMPQQYELGTPIED